LSKQNIVQKAMIVIINECVEIMYKGNTGVVKISTSC